MKRIKEVIEEMEKDLEGLKKEGSSRYVTN
jgi:hypothetical protein